MSEALLKAVRSFRRADTEFHRANNTGEQPRLNKAGTRYAIAKIKLFAIAEKMSVNRPDNDATGENQGG